MTVDRRIFPSPAGAIPSPELSAVTCAGSGSEDSTITQNKPGRGSNGEDQSERDVYNPERPVRFAPNSRSQRSPALEKTCAEGSSRSYGKAGYVRY